MPLIPFLESQMSTPYTPSVGNTEQCLWDTAKSEVSRQECSALFSSSESVWYVMEISWCEIVLREKVAQTLSDGNSFQKRSSREKLFKGLKMATCCCGTA